MVFLFHSTERQRVHGAVSIDSTELCSVITPQRLPSDRLYSRDAITQSVCQSYSLDLSQQRTLSVRFPFVRSSTQGAFQLDAGSTEGSRTTSTDNVQLNDAHGRTRLI